MELTFSNPKFQSANDASASFSYLGYTGGTVTITDVKYETTTQQLTVKAKYERVGYNSQGVYLSLNNDRTSMSSSTELSSSYNDVVSGYGYKVGTGECYAVRKTDDVTVTLTSSSSSSALAPLRSGGGASKGSGVTDVTLTVTSTVSPAILVAGTTPIFFRAIYGSGWKELEHDRWELGTDGYTKEINTYITFNTESLKAYVISYDGKGGTEPFDQIKYHDETIYLDESMPTKDTTYNANSYTVYFDSNGGTSTQTSILSYKDIEYIFKEWVSTALGGTAFQPSDAYTNNSDDTLVAYYIQNTTQHSIVLPNASHADATFYRVVKYNTNGGTGTLNDSKSQATVTYEFDGWYPSSGSAVRGMPAGAAYTPSSTHTLVAHWLGYIGEYSAITLPTASKSSTTDYRTITFDPNGGTVSIPSKDSTATRTYTNTGWYTKASGGILRGKPGASYVPSYDEDETLYAQYSSSVGTFSQVTLPTPTRTNYTFLGWTTQKDNINTKVTSPYRPSSNTTLYALWEEEQAKSFVMNSDGRWLKGKTFIMDEDGIWRKAKKIYVLQENGSWKINKNN